MYQLPGTISPKVALPAWALAALGAICVGVGLLVENTGALVEVGIGLLAGAGIVLPVGYKAPPGTVITDTSEVASDELLDERAAKRIPVAPVE